MQNMRIIYNGIRYEKKQEHDDENGMCVVNPFIFQHCFDVHVKTLTTIIKHFKSKVLDLCFPYIMKVANYLLIVIQ